MNDHQAVDRSQALFREVNERIRDLNDTFGESPLADPRIDFICECAELTCVAIVRATPLAYAEARARPTRFLVAAGHADAAARVVLALDGIQVVDQDGHVDGSDAFSTRRRAAAGGTND
jgi:hypothetical protein